MWKRSGAKTCKQLVHVLARGLPVPTADKAFAVTGFAKLFIN